MPILAVHHGRNLPEVCKVLDEGKGWFRANWRTAAVLVLIFGLALFLRVYFVYGLAFQLPHVNCDSIYTPTYSGGSDSYYWDRALCYSFQSGRDLGQERREPPAEPVDGRGPRRLHALLRRLDPLFLPARPADDGPQALGRELVPEGLDRHRTSGVPQGEPDQRVVRPPRGPLRLRDR